MRRNGVISWDEYFMGLAHLSAKRSKDPSTQVGACIVDQNNRVVSIGYNGMPFGCDDDTYPWGKVGELVDTKYPYVVHAELNAILNARTTVRDCIVYVSLFPCNECAKAIIQAGIKEVVYESDKYADQELTKVSKKMMRDAGIKLRKLDYSLNVDIKKRVSDE